MLACASRPGVYPRGRPRDTDACAPPATQMNACHQLGGAQMQLVCEAATREDARAAAGRRDGGDGGAEHDLAKLRAAALTAAGLALPVRTLGDLLSLEIRAADAALPPQPLVLAKLRPATRLAGACTGTQDTSATRKCTCAREAQTRRKQGGRHGEASAPQQVCLHHTRTRLATRARLSPLLAPPRTRGTGKRACGHGRQRKRASGDAGQGEAREARGAVSRKGPLRLP